MGTQFQAQRSEDAIIISPQICASQQEFKEPISKKQRTLDESYLNPLYPNNSLKRQNCLFFKTRLCVKFRHGSCTNGPNCSFAHGSKELRGPPPNWQDRVAKDGNVSEEQMLVKNKICRKFYRGEVCSYGESCTFMHVEPGMLGEYLNASKGSTSPIESGDDNGDIGHNSESIVVVGSGNGCSQKPIFWKTRMCNKWGAMGHCPFGDKCHFAHGHAELMENIAAAPLRPLGSPMSSTVKHQTSGFLKWKRLQKISHIYADWIGDVPLRICSSPSKTGT